MLHSYEEYWNVFNVLNLTCDVHDRISAMQDARRRSVVNALGVLYRMTVTTICTPLNAHNVYDRRVAGFQIFVDFISGAIKEIRVLFSAFSFTVIRSDYGTLIVSAIDFIH
jgi:hypothetical protein